MLHLDPWINRIESELGALVRSVEGTVELAAARRDYQRAPAIWVMPVAERPQPARGLPLEQRVTGQIAVVTVVRNVRDAQGRAGLEELMPVRAALLQALIGWKPDPEGTKVEYAGGRIIDLRDRVLWWQDEFRADYWLREEY